MDPIVLEPETLRYWSFIKDANFNVKNALLWSKMPIIKKEDVKISQWAMDIVKDVPQIAENTDYDKVKLNYIMQKYG